MMTLDQKVLQAELNDLKAQLVVVQAQWEMAQQAASDLARQRDGLAVQYNLLGALLAEIAKGAI
jgi:hypothetical protein